MNRHCSDDPQADPLLTAASALVADRGLPTNNQVVDGLLRFLDYHDAEVALRQSRARLLRAAARFRRLFHLPVPDAPGLIFLGGKADPACLGAAYAALRVGSLSGSGVTPQR